MMDFQGSKKVAEAAVRIFRILEDHLSHPSHKIAALNIANILVQTGAITKQPPQDEGDTDAVRQ
jgi:hypothetical protein